MNGGLGSNGSFGGPIVREDSGRGEPGGHLQLGESVALFSPNFRVREC